MVLNLVLATILIVYSIVTYWRIFFLKEKIKGLDESVIFWKEQYEKSVENHTETRQQLLNQQVMLSRVKTRLEQAKGYLNQITNESEENEDTVQN